MLTKFRFDLGWFIFLAVYFDTEKKYMYLSVHINFFMLIFSP